MTTRRCHGSIGARSAAGRLIEGVTVVLLASLSATPAFAGPVARAPHPASRAEKTVSDWNRRFIEADELVLAGKYRKAHGLASDIAYEITHRTVRWDAAGRALALVSLVRALAAAGMGEEDEALWYWHVAGELLPKLAEIDLSAYGEAGKLLKGHPLGAEHVTPAAEDEADFEDETDLEEMTPPRKLRRIEPDYPYAQRGWGSPLTVVVSVLVTREGHPICPEIVDSEGGVIFVYATLEALRLWEFEPAQHDGEPIAVYYTLTVNYKPRG